MRLNILWVLLNLIPIEPLDGGRLARYICERKFGAQGYRASIMLGLACAAVAAPYLYYQGYLFFGTLLLIFGFQNYKTLREFRAESGENNPFSSYIQAIEAVNNNELANAKTLLKKLLKSKDNRMKHLAIESMAKVYVQEDESGKSYDMLMQADPQLLKEGKCLLCKLAFDRKNYELVGKYSRDIYVIDPSYDIAVLNSKAFAHLNQPVFSGAWLETASQFGPEYKDSIKDVLAQPDYDAIRDQEPFKQYVEKIQKHDILS
jgi:hypothetical protein